MFLIALLEEWEAVTSTIASHRVSAKGTRKKRTQIRHLMLSLKLCDCRYDVLCLFKMQIRLQKALSLHEGGLTPLKWYSCLDLFEPSSCYILMSCVQISLELTPHRGANASYQICTQLMKNGGKNKSVALIILYRVHTYKYIYLFILWYNIILNNKI